MNLGYTTRKMLDNGVNNMVCPICGKDIYVSKYNNDFACADFNCALGHGANNLIIELNNMLSKLE